MTDKPTWSDAALAVWGILGDHPVAYHPALAKALGNDINAALFLGQIMYWSNKGTWKPGWVAKTQKEIYNETALTRSQQERVRTKLARLGVISEKKMDVPARLYFRVHFAKLTKLLMAHLTDNPDTVCRKPATKGAGNQQSEAQKPADQDAENQQPIPEITPETTPETTPEKSDGKPSQTPTLDRVFPDSAAARSAGLLVGGQLDGLDDHQKAQVAAPGSGQREQHMDLAQSAWYISCKNITFPHEITWVDVFEYAKLFSGLFGIPVPSTKTGIGQWRRGTVETFIAFADGMRMANEPVESKTVVRHARWGLQVLHARRALGDAWTFEIVSPISTTGTLRVVSGDLRNMQQHYDCAFDLPTWEMAQEYYASLPQNNRRNGGGGAAQTEQTAELLRAQAQKGASQ